MEIEIRLNLEEAQKEWNDFKKRIIDGIEEDDILGNAKADVQNYGIYYDKQGTGVIQKETEHLYELLDQLRQMDETGTSSYYGDNRAQAMEDLRTYTEALMSSMEELDELIKQTIIHTKGLLQENITDLSQIPLQGISVNIQNQKASISNIEKRRIRLLTKQTQFQKKNKPSCTSHNNNKKKSKTSSKQIKVNIIKLPLSTLSNEPINPLMCAEYIDDIYTYLKSIENQNLPNGNYMKEIKQDAGLIVCLCKDIARHASQLEAENQGVEQSADRYFELKNLLTGYFLIDRHLQIEDNFEIIIEELRKSMENAGGWDNKGEVTVSTKNHLLCMFRYLLMLVNEVNK